MKSLKNTILLTVLLSLCFKSVVSADLYKLSSSTHSHSDIVNIAKAFIADEINQQDDSTHINIKPLDNRLQLHQCTAPLLAFWPPGAKQVGHTTVGIRCNDHKPWKIYLGAQIKRFEKVWVTSTAIARGTLLKDSNIILEKREISSTHNEYFTNQQNPIGLQAKRPIRKGDIIQVRAFEKPLAIKRGDRVIVIARVGGLEIRTVATALSSAAEGDRIKVKNISSNKEFEGVLTENSVVHVNI